MCGDSGKYLVIEAHIFKMCFTFCEHNLCTHHNLEVQI